MCDYLWIGALESAELTPVGEFDIKVSIILTLSGEILQNRFIDKYTWSGDWPNKRWETLRRDGCEDIASKLFGADKWPH